MQKQKKQIYETASAKFASKPFSQIAPEFIHNVYNEVKLSSDIYRMHYDTYAYDMRRAVEKIMHSDINFKNVLAQKSLTILESEYIAATAIHALKKMFDMTDEILLSIKETSDNLIAASQYSNSIEIFYHKEDTPHFVLDKTFHEFRHIMQSYGLTSIPISMLENAVYSARIAACIATIFKNNPEIKNMESAREIAILGDFFHENSALEEEARYAGSQAIGIINQARRGK